MKLHKHINKVFLFLYINFYSLNAYAGKKEVARRLLIPPVKKKSQHGFGEITSDVFDFSKGSHRVLTTLVLFGGIAFVFFGIQAYSKYRRNPEEIPLSKAIVLLFIGLVLIVLSFIPIQL